MAGKHEACVLLLGDSVTTDTLAQIKLCTSWTHSLGGMGVGVAQLKSQFQAFCLRDPHELDLTRNLTQERCTFKLTQAAAKATSLHRVLKARDLRNSCHDY